MGRLFGWLTLACFWIVLGAIAIWLFEAAYFGESNSTLMGCRSSGLGGFVCDDQPLKGLRLLLFNLPLLFVLAPPFTLTRSSIPDPWVLNLMYVADLVLVLALLHIVRMVVRLVKAGRVRDDAAGGA